MKHLLLTTIAAVMLVGCLTKQLRKTKAIPIQQLEPSTAKTPDISINTAVFAGDVEAVKQSLAAGADVNEKATLGRGTPLHSAAIVGSGEIVELLIAAGADLNANYNVAAGGTPLHMAAFGGSKESAELLIAAGADVNFKDILGQTPLDRAIQQKQTETADLLRKHGGKTGEELKAEEK